jgi:hypothetical protein
MKPAAVWRAGSVFNCKGIFHAPIVEKKWGGKASKIVKYMLDGELVREEGTRDNVVGGSHSNGISMVRSCWQKPCGEEGSWSEFQNKAEVNIGTMLLAEITAMASPWFVGVDKNLVVKKGS